MCNMLLMADCPYLPIPLKKPIPTSRKHLFNQRENHPVVRYRGHFYFRSHLCLKFDLLGPSLHQAVVATRFKGIPLVQVRHVGTQLLQTLRYFRGLGLIHCDLKPENVLYMPASSSKIAVIDFGSSCFQGEATATYVQSRFYRAPEVILGLPYDCQADMWSLGCRTL
eukprot:UC1_evm3s943